MGGAGMFAVSVYMIFMSDFYEKLVAANIPQGTAAADLANVTNEAKKLAGPEVINATLMIPLVLVVAFAGLNWYMKNKKQSEPVI
jgi:ATP-dependent Zn protease